MDRTSALNFVLTAGKRLFRNRNILTGQHGTSHDAADRNAVQEEIMHVIEQAGLTPDANDWTQLLEGIGILMVGRLLNVRLFTGSGSFSAYAGAKGGIGLLLGGGGAGGGGFATSASSWSVGSGGAAGGLALFRWTGVLSGIAVTIGAGGAPVPGAAGGAGGTSSFGALAIAPGGGGGPTATVAIGSTVISGQAGPGATPSVGGGAVGMILSRGQPGPNGLILPDSPISGQGAPSILAGGGNNTSGGLGGAGGYGAGGGGSANLASAADSLGGAGGAGLGLIWEFS